MGVPTQPETSSIVTEAYRKIGINTIDTTQATRGSSNIVPEIINNIWLHGEQDGNTRLKVLQATTTFITTIGDSKYAFPTGMSEEINLTLLDGTYRDNLQQIGADTSVTIIKLATTTASTTAGSTGISTMTTNEAVGKYIIITSASTAVGEMHQIIAYSTTTSSSESSCEIPSCLATLNSSLVGEPGSTASYLVVDQMIDLDEDNTLDVGGLNVSLTPGKPSAYMKVMEDGVEYFVLDKPPDLATYGIFLRYYANPMLMETGTDGTVWQRMYLDWWDAIVTGVAWKLAESEDDDRAVALKRNFEELRQGIIDKERPSGGEWEGFSL